MKKVNRKPMRTQYLPAQSKNEQNDFWNTAQKAITVIAGVGGMLAFWLWIAGRMYAAGYFLAMNIPSFSVSFQSWEYIEQAWVPLTFIFATGLLAEAIISLPIDLVLDWLSGIVENAIKRKPRQQNEKLIKQIRRSLLVANVAILLLAILIIAKIALLYVFETGLAFGNYYVFNATQNINLIANTPLKIDIPAQLITISNETEYSYENLKLLTFNNGKYYLFSNIDQTTCKPEKVYIIDESKISNVIMGQVSPAQEGNCHFSIYLFLNIFPIPLSGPSYSQ